MTNRVDSLYEALRSVVDPELHVNIVDLGLVYGVTETAPGRVRIALTLTTPGCPVGAVLVDAVRRVVSCLPGIDEVHVELTFDPPWSVDRISPEGRRHLNLF